MARAVLHHYIHLCWGFEEQSVAQLPSPQGNGVPAQECGVEGECGSIKTELPYLMPWRSRGGVRTERILRTRRRRRALQGRRGYRRQRSPRRAWQRTGCLVAVREGAQLQWSRRQLESASAFGFHRHAPPLCDTHARMNMLITCMRARMHKFMHG